MDDVTKLILKSETIRDSLLKINDDEARSLASYITYIRTQASRTQVIEYSLLSGAVHDGEMYLANTKQ